MFFCKYLDPVYLKQEKLDVIVSLACEENIVQILNELREYATEIDIAKLEKNCDKQLKYLNIPP